MIWFIENWPAVLAVLIVALGAAIAIGRILKPNAAWINVLVYVLSIIEQLAPEQAKAIKAKVKAGEHNLTTKSREALHDAVATVDPKKATPAHMKKA